MALLKEKPSTVNISFDLYMKLVELQQMLRRHRNVEEKYNDVKCPSCGQNHWAHPEDNKWLVNCVICGYEYNVCDCGAIVTEEEVKLSGDSRMCKPCRVKFCEENDMCRECEKDLISGENNGMQFLYCPNHCVDEVKLRGAI